MALRQQPGRIGVEKPCDTFRYKNSPSYRPAMGFHCSAKPSLPPSDLTCASLPVAHTRVSKLGLGVRASRFSPSSKIWTWLSLAVPEFVMSDGQREPDERALGAHIDRPLKSFPLPPAESSPFATSATPKVAQKAPLARRHRSGCCLTGPAACSPPRLLHLAVPSGRRCQEQRQIIDLTWVHNPLWHAGLRLQQDPGGQLSQRLSSARWAADSSGSSATRSHRSTNCLTPCQPSVQESGYNSMRLIMLCPAAA